MKTLILLAALLFAGPAMAQLTWDTEPGTSDTNKQSCSFLESPGLRSGLWATADCFTDATAAESPSVTTAIDTSMCENIDACLLSELGDDATFANTAKVYNFITLTSATISASDFGALLVSNVTLNGDPSLSDTSCIYGFSATNVYVRFTTGEASTTSRLSLTCHARR